jgi:DNA-binding FadR family transcriptional regulator
MREDADLDVGLTTGALRAILAAPASTMGRADDLARRLGDAIRVGLILDGERLPSEARLARQLGVASVTLREVLRMLRSEGLIATRRGRGGGTVVTAPADGGRTLAQRLRELTMLDVRDLGDQRSAILCAAAELAASRVQPADVERLRSHVQRLDAGRDASELRRADSLFTVEVAVAAQSPRLAQEDLRLRAEVGDLWWVDPSPADHDVAVEMRTGLVSAISARRADEARARAWQIVDHDTRRLAGRTLRAQVSSRRSAKPATGSVSELTAELTAEFDDLFASLSRLATVFESLVAEAGADNGPRRRDLAGLRPVIEQILDKHSGTLVGAGVVVEPGLLEDVEWWLEWLWRSPGGHPEVLRINLDPRAPDFYDYAATDWFRQPRTSGRPTVAGPYVDAPCTGQYALTLSAPVHALGRFIGVVAADVPVSVLERRLMRQWGGRDPESWLVVTPGRRVLVSTDTRHLPGELLAGDHDPARVVPFRYPTRDR